MRHIGEAKEAGHARRCVQSIMMVVCLLYWRLSSTTHLAERKQNSPTHLVTDELKPKRVDRLYRRVESWPADIVYEHGRLRARKMPPSVSKMTNVINVD